MAEQEEIILKRSFKTKSGELENFIKVHLNCELKQLPQLQQALEHPSTNSTDKSKQISFQRLEWIGDSVLTLCVSEILFHQFPDDTETQLSRKRTLIVREHSLAQWAREVNLDTLIQIQTNSTLSDGILCDSVEAVIGCVFLNVGLEKVQAIARQIINFNSVETRSLLNPKSTLQDWAVSAFGLIPSYTVESQLGPDHKPIFEVTVRVGDLMKTTASSSSKHLAEEAAALSLFQEENDVATYQPSRKISFQNPKSYAQIKFSKMNLGTLTYKLLPVLGPAKSPFQVRVTLSNSPIEAIGFGPSRKEAEIEAILTLLEKFESNVDENPKEKLTFQLEKIGKSISYRQGKSDSEFIVEAYIDDELVGKGKGTSLNSAKQAAAIAALEDSKVKWLLLEVSSTLDQKPSDLANNPSASSSSSMMIYGNPKGALQELLQSEGRLDLLEYRLMAKAGLEHTPEFLIHLMYGGKKIGEGTGKRKKDAESMAATKALQERQKWL